MPSDARPSLCHEFAITDRHNHAERERAELPSRLNSDRPNSRARQQRRDKRENRHQPVAVGQWWDVELRPPKFGLVEDDASIFYGGMTRHRRVPETNHRIRPGPDGRTFSLVEFSMWIREATSHPIRAHGQVREITYRPEAGKSVALG